MEAVILEDAEILIPNSRHKSFSGSNVFIPKDKIVKGDVVVVDGNKKGKEFKYRLFKTNKKYIYLDKIKINNMENKSNATGDMGKPIIVNTSAGRWMGKVPIAFTLVGVGVAYGYCKYKKHDSKHLKRYMIGGALIGYVLGRILQDGKVISVQSGN